MRPWFVCASLISILVVTNGCFGMQPCDTSRDCAQEQICLIAGGVGRCAAAPPAAPVTTSTSPDGTAERAAPSEAAPVHVSFRGTLPVGAETLRGAGFTLTFTSRRSR